MEAKRQTLPLKPRFSSQTPSKRVTSSSDSSNVARQSSFQASRSRAYSHENTPYTENYNDVYPLPIPPAARYHPTDLFQQPRRIKEGRGPQKEAQSWASLLANLPNPFDSDSEYEPECECLNAIEVQAQLHLASCSQATGRKFINR